MRQIESNAAGFLRSQDPEFLHQLRVGMRRLRAALRAFRPVLARRPARALARKLRGFSPVLGAARDWDVFSAWIAGQERVSRAALRMHAEARREARGAVASAKFERAIEAARDLAVHGAQEAPLQRLALRALRKGHAKALKAARRIEWESAAERHRLRIRVKRLRYAAEYFTPCLPAAHSAYVARLKALQDLLGGLNDAAVARRLLRGLPGASAALARKVRAREARLLSALPAAWAGFERQRPFWAPPA
ncbi:MAG TPA: CHAD domain-containing protein [Burkholderiales bacterium]|nr:CHAD domain-containing protein [Burkholderiales bacterium]